MIMIAAQLLSGGEIRGAVLSTVGISIVLYVFSIQEMNRTVDRAHKLEIEIMENYQKELETTVDKRTQELRVANEKAEHLLLNILPENVARELADDPDKTISMRYPNATVLFTDVVNFTQMTSTMSAESTVNMLNRMITMFDERAEREGIEKIKTIGDAYMAASGLTEDSDNDGAYRMVHFAKGLLQDIEEFNKTADFPIEIRIGINSGELVAGVIGKIKFIYDIWGDTVNVASRMESTGTAMKIHITKKTYEQIKDKYSYTEKVEDDIKGKGRMRGYYV
jgi:class 3 adenylate cyclase